MNTTPREHTGQCEATSSTGLSPPPTAEEWGTQLPEALRSASLIKQAVREALEEQNQSPWLNTEDAIRYSALPAGSFRKYVADGRIRHRGTEKRHIFRRDELDEDRRAL
jgi:hypothetical protein